MLELGWCGPERDPGSIVVGDTLLIPLINLVEGDWLQEWLEHGERGRAIEFNWSHLSFKTDFAHFCL